MKVELNFTEADRSKLGIGEWLQIDVNAVSITEAIVLQKGIEKAGVIIAYDSPAHWRAALAGKKQEDGPTVVDWCAELVLAWLTLRRAGVDIDPAELEYDADNLAWRLASNPTDPGEPGKDPSTPETTS